MSGSSEAAKKLSRLLRNNAKNYKTKVVNFASVFILILARPAFVVVPRNKVVGVGRRLTVKCMVTGSPSPAVYWSQVASQVSQCVVLQCGATLCIVICLSG